MNWTRNDNRSMVTVDRRVFGHLLLAFVALTRTAPAHAANERGNGGGAVVCRDGSGIINRAELLDYYEARSIRGLTLDLGGDELSLEQKVEHVLRRLERLDPERAGIYRADAAFFFANVGHPTDTVLIPLPDTDGTYFPRGCVYEQLAIHFPSLPHDSTPPYVVNGDLWAHLSDTDRAGLVLHEIIYNEASSLGQENSRATRYFNARLSSTQSLTWDLAAYNSARKDSGLVTAPHWVDGKIPCVEGSIEWQAPGILGACDLLRPMTPTMLGQALSLNAGSRIEVYPSMALKHTTLRYANLVGFPQTAGCAFSNLAYGDGNPFVSIHFYESGRIRQIGDEPMINHGYASLTTPEVSCLAYSAWNVPAPVAAFYPNGNPTMVLCSAPTSDADRHAGCDFPLYAGEYFRLDGDDFPRVFEAPYDQALTRVQLQENGYPVRAKLRLRSAQERISMMTASGVRRSFGHGTVLEFDDRGRVKNDAAEPPPGPIDPPTQQLTFYLPQGASTTEMIALSQTITARALTIEASCGVEIRQVYAVSEIGIGYMQRGNQAAVWVTPTGNERTFRAIQFVTTNPGPAILCAFSLARANN